MPPQLTECLSCPRCLKVFNAQDQKPISLGCGHTVCQKCLINLLNKKCPNCQSEQSIITKSVEQLPVNYALLQLVGIAIRDKERPDTTQMTENSSLYESCKRYIEDMAVHMKSISETGTESDDEDENSKYEHGSTNSILSRPMQRKLVTLINSQLVEEEGRARAMRAARSLGERAVAELILQHQNPQQLSANLWAAVRARGCQFLGPAMQEEVLKLILLALIDGSALCRKVLVLFVVQKLEATYPQASKTAIGHVVQLLYRASCFKVTKKEEESSLMQLKEEFRSYESLRREHDSQIVQIAMEGGLRISPEQWSSLLYGDSNHKSHMQSIIDKLQTPESFTQSVNELMVVLQKTGDPAQLQSLKPHLQFLAMIDPSQDKQVPSWKNLEAILKTLKIVIDGLISYLNNYSHKKSDILPAQNARYKTSMCRDFTTTRSCPRGINCSFAHSEDELERFRAKKKYSVKPFTSTMLTSAALTPKERQDLAKVNNKSSMLDIRNMASINPEDARNKIEACSLKSLPIATNVVKPMMSSLATKTVSLTTDTTPSMATTAIPSVSTSHSMAPTVNNSNISSVIARHPTPRIQPVSLQPEAVYYPPQLNNRLPTPNPVYQPHPPPGVRQPLTGAAARYPQPYPVNLPYQPDQSPCVHGYHNYHFDGQVPPGNYPGQWPQTPGAPPFYMQGMTPPVYQDKYVRYPPMPPAPGIQPSVPIQNVVQTTVQHLPPGTVQTTPNQVNSLQDLKTRRQEILSHIHHNIQLTPSLSESDQLQYTARGASSTSQANRREKTPIPICTSGAYCSTVSGTDQHNVCNGLSQTEKAYTILKKELFNNPQQAPDPRDLSWPTPPISVTAIAEFEDQLTQSHPSLHSDSILVTESQKSSCSSVDDDDFNSFCVSLDEDLETDGDTNYSQWSGGLDWSTPSSSNNRTSCSSTVSVDLFDWFEKQTMQYNTVQRMSSSEFIPFDPPIVSRFGPISRAARSKSKNSDPVIVTADEAIMKMTPVTAITPTQRPYPVTSPAPSRYRIPGQSIPPLSATNTQPTHGQPHTLWHQHSNLSFAHRGIGGQQLHRELNRLEHNASEAPTQDERLAYELQAIELKISMRTGKRPEPIEQPDLGNIEPPANSALSPPFQQQRTALRMAAVEAQIERKDELSLRQQQEEVDRQLAEKLIMEELKSKKYSRK